MSKPQLLADVISDYNRSENMKQLKLPTDEIKALRFLGSRSSTFIGRLTVLWGQEKPSNTAVPMSLLAENWLQEATELPVHRPQLLTLSVELPSMFSD